VGHKGLWAGPGNHRRAEQSSAAQELAYALQNASRGGFAEAVMRIIVAVSGVDRTMDRRQADAAESIIHSHERLRHLSSDDLKQLIRNQARILSAHAGLALKGLAVMLPTQAEREEAFDIALKIAIADSRVDHGERRLLLLIQKVLKLHYVNAA
jgi:tellurite resistance protein